MRHRRRRSAWLTGLLFGLAFCGETAAAPPSEQPYRYLAVIAGDCERLILGDRDRTAGCGDTLVNVDFGDGRVVFAFTSPAEHGTVVTTFLGRSSVQKDLRHYRLEVDEVWTTRIDANGRPSNVVEAAAGHCAMTGDPTQEKARFECTATRPSGRTTATFLSAGTPTVYAGVRSGDGRDAGSVGAPIPRDRSAGDGARGRVLQRASRWSRTAHQHAAIVSSVPATAHAPGDAAAPERRHAARCA